MNTNQKRILLAVIALIAGMLMYPPFHRVASNGAAYNMGYGWIFDPPGRDATVNVAILLMQWVGVLVVGGLGFFLAKGANPSTHSQGPIGVGGWLLLLVAGMLVIGPLLGAARVGSAMYFVEAQFPALKTMGEWVSYKAVMWLAFLVFAALSVYGGWGLLRGKDWSVVGRAKAVLWWVGPGGSLVLGVLIPKMTLSESNIDGGFVGSLIASVLSAAIWTAYLSKSKRVRNTYGGENALAGTSTESAVIIATAPPTTSWQNSPPAQAANATTPTPPPTPILTQTSFAVDEDAVYSTVADELESGNTSKGLWTRAFSESGGNENQAKALYIKWRVNKLVAEATQNAPIAHQETDNLNTRCDSETHYSNVVPPQPSNAPAPADSRVGVVVAIVVAAGLFGVFLIGNNRSGDANTPHQVSSGVAPAPPPASDHIATKYQPPKALARGQVFTPAHKKLALFSEPDMGAPRVAIVEQGTPLTVIDFNENGWLLLESSFRVTGWASRDHVVDLGITDSKYSSTAQARVPTPISANVLQPVPPSDTNTRTADKPRALTLKDYERAYELGSK